MIASTLIFLTSASVVWLALVVLDRALPRRSTIFEVTYNFVSQAGRYRYLGADVQTIDIAGKPTGGTFTATASGPSGIFTTSARRIGPDAATALREAWEKAHAGGWPTTPWPWPSVGRSTAEQGDTECPTPTA